MTSLDHPIRQIIDQAATMLELQLRSQGGEGAEHDAAVLLQRSAELTFAGFSPAGTTSFERNLVKRCSLSTHEVRVVRLLVAVAVSKRVAELVVACSGGTTCEVGLQALRDLVYGDNFEGAFRELGANAAIRRLGLIERTDGGGPDVHESQQTFAISQRVLAVFHGEDSIDVSIRGFTRIPVDVKLDTLAVPDGLGAELRLAARVYASIVVVSGMPGAGRRTCVSAYARDADVNVLEVDASKLARDLDGLRRQLRAIARECRLLGRQPLIANLDALVDEKGERLGLVGGELTKLVEGTIFVTTGLHRPTMRWGRPVIVVEMKPPTSAQRAALWSTSLGEGTPEDGEHLAGLYPLAPALVVRAAEAAKAHAGGRALRPDDIYAGVRTVLDDKLGHFAKRLTVTQTWDDIVLPPEQMESIIELVARIRERRTVYEQWGFAAKVGKGLGVSALFSGPPGTGKTMVASLIARELGLEIYQVDLAKVVSKWIGETEKNLAALFDAAEAGHAVLLFDEADALFGKRTDVKSSNDRNANLETNYLLQRLESFTGICLLTSNHESHIDPAFQRRLSLHLRFDVPDLAERAHLWTVMLPAEAPLAPGVDFAALARKYDMTGGYIRNAALRAAFLAANAQTVITGALLERAARAEYESMGKLAYESTEVVS